MVKITKIMVDRGEKEEEHVESDDHELVCILGADTLSDINVIQLQHAESKKLIENTFF